MVKTSNRVIDMKKKKTKNCENNLKTIFKKFSVLKNRKNSPIKEFIRELVAKCNLFFL